MINTDTKSANRNSRSVTH